MIITFIYIWSYAHLNMCWHAASIQVKSKIMIHVKIRAKLGK